MGVLLQLLISNFRDKNCQRDAQYDVRKNEADIVSQRIADNDGNVLASGQEREVFQAIPFAAPDTALNGVLLEGQYDTGHGHVIVDEQVEQGRQHHQIER